MPVRLNSYHFARECSGLFADKAVSRVASVLLAVTIEISRLTAGYSITFAKQLSIVVPKVLV